MGIHQGKHGIPLEGYLKRTKKSPRIHGKLYQGSGNSNAAPMQILHKFWKSVMFCDMACGMACSMTKLLQNHGNPSRKTWNPTGKLPQAHEKVTPDSWEAVPRARRFCPGGHGCPDENPLANSTTCTDRCFETTVGGTSK